VVIPTTPLKSVIAVSSWDCSDGIHDAPTEISDRWAFTSRQDFDHHGHLIGWAKTQPMFTDPQNTRPTRFDHFHNCAHPQSKFLQSVDCGALAIHLDDAGPLVRTEKFERDDGPGGH
jgi:hypothetical protein